VDRGAKPTKHISFKFIALSLYCVADATLFLSEEDAQRSSGVMIQQFRFSFNSVIIVIEDRCLSAW